MWVFTKQAKGCPKSCELCKKTCPVVCPRGRIVGATGFTKADSLGQIAFTCHSGYTLLDICIPNAGFRAHVLDCHYHSKGYRNYFMDD